MYNYDKIAVGERIQARRKALGLSQDTLAERIDRVPKSITDIERGKVGMSLETMLNICSLIKLSPNELLFGYAREHTLHEETTMIMDALNECSEKQRKDAYELLKLFIVATK